MFGVVCHVVSESKTSVHSQKTGFVCLRAKSAQIVFPFHRLGTLRFLLSVPTKFQHQKSRSVRGMAGVVPVISSKTFVSTVAEKLSSTLETVNRTLRETFRTLAPPVPDTVRCWLRPRNSSSSAALSDERRRRACRTGV